MATAQKVALVLVFDETEAYTPEKVGAVLDVIRTNLTETHKDLINQRLFAAHGADATRVIEVFDVALAEGVNSPPPVA